MTGDWGDVAGVLRPSSIGFDVPGKPTPKRSNLSSPTDSYSILSGTSVARGMARVASSFAPTAFGATAKVPKIYSTGAAHYTPVFDRSSDGLSLGSGSALKAGFSVGSLESMAPPPEDFLKTMDLEDDGDLSDAPGLQRLELEVLRHAGPSRSLMGRGAVVWGSTCPYPTHKKNKLDPDLALIYCVNAKEHAMPTPTFTEAELEASALWPDYKDQVLEHQGWAQFKQLIVHNAGVDQDERVTRDQAVELVAKPAAVLPTTAKKRRFVADFQYAPGPADKAEERVDLLALGFAQSLSTIEEAVADLNNCYG
eukprot:scaffold5679_cov63-Cyclotella_meneghiniana.AAC.2